VFAIVLFRHTASGQHTSSFLKNALDCNDRTGILCKEVFDPIGYGGTYTGHDEPAVLFYSDVPGSGNSGIYTIRLPKDPPTLPKQDGTGGTFNFQLYPAFWVGFTMCDDQSAPNPGGSSVGPNIPCKPDSDFNIFENLDPTRPNYIGKHPGSGFMELQFYPPGWFSSCDIKLWCSALNIDSVSENLNTPGTGQYGGQGNNAACGGDIEYVNFAFITKSGIPTGPPGPLLANNDTLTPNADTLFFNPGDILRIVMHDTTHGLKITIIDLSTGETGTMTASAANGFAQIKFDPNGVDCDPTTHNLPYDFHPMYATSSERTRTTWAAASGNVAFSQELGHFEYCDAVDVEGGNCILASTSDPSGIDIDDQGCFDASFAASFGLVPIGGCFGEDDDFDGVPYQFVWAGTFRNVKRDKSLHAEAIQFTSPLFLDSSGEVRDYHRVGFEVDLPRIEFATNPPCQRFISNPGDPNPGQGCVNPPVGASFYPLYTTGRTDEGENCTWRFGGTHIPGTTNTFGGSSTTEFGSLLPAAYPGPGGSPTFRYGVFRRVLNYNPCPVREE
jgi:hypothetical protein